MAAGAAAPEDRSKADEQTGTGEEGKVVRYRLMEAALSRQCRRGAAISGKKCGRADNARIPIRRQQPADDAADAGNPAEEQHQDHRRDSDECAPDRDSIGVKSVAADIPSPLRS